MQRKIDPASGKSGLDARLRLYIYRFFISHGRSSVGCGDDSTGIAHPLNDLKAALERLSQTHAFVLQENGELWRAAPFSAVPTAFPVKVGRRS